MAAAPATSLAQKSNSGAGTDAFSVGKITARPVPGGDEHGHPSAEVTFDIVWNSKTPPDAIFYRSGKSQWLACKPTRPEKRPFGGGPNDFMVVYMKVPMRDIKPGDKLTLTVARHGHDPVPTQLKNMSGDALYYRLAGSEKWQVKKVNVPKLPATK
jgi:hypothetical protein